jgi:hypothetical protein
MMDTRLRDRLKLAHNLLCEQEHWGSADAVREAMAEIDKLECQTGYLHRELDRSVPGRYFNPNGED